MKRERGFTLVEVMVAISILAVMTMLIWQAMGSTVQSKERFDKQGETFHAASLAVSQISRDLEMAVVYSSLDLLGASPSGEQSTKSVFSGSNNGDQDKLSFSTFSHVRHFKDAKESDQAEVSWFLEQDPDGEDTWLLKKREASPPDAQPEEGGQTSTLLDGVLELNFRYYDPNKLEFVDEWDSSGLDNLNKLPRLVEIILSVRDPMDSEASHQFSTYAWLSMSPGPNDF